MAQLTIEGTWEEIALQSARFSGKRVRLTVLGDEGQPANGPGDAVRAGETLADALAGRVGRVDLGRGDLSSRTGQAFTDIVAEKHARRREVR
jgi:hypothetical protein